jgi:quinol monooxygenase YgiN
MAMADIPKPTPEFFTTPPQPNHLIQVTARWPAGTHPTGTGIEVSHGVGTKATVTHQAFPDEGALLDSMKSWGTSEAKPNLLLLRAADLSAPKIKRIVAAEKSVVLGNLLYGFERNLDKLGKAGIEVTAKWTCKPGQTLDELKHWWLQVGTEAHAVETGMLRFQVYQVVDEDALIIHETFHLNADLKFHLTKGMAAKYKSQIDQVAVPEAYVFRGPVSWLIRTYSKFMRLPATYARAR